MDKDQELETTVGGFIIMLELLCALHRLNEQGDQQQQRRDEIFEALTDMFRDVCEHKRAAP